MKIWRLLQAIGAVARKNAVDPRRAGEQAQEDFVLLLRQIGDAGGEDLPYSAHVIDGMSDAEVRALFNAACGAAFDALYHGLGGGGASPFPRRIGRNEPARRRKSRIL